MHFLPTIVLLSSALLSPTQGHSGLDRTKCSNAYFSEKWTATGEVPGKLAEVPPAPLHMMYNYKRIIPNDTVTTEDMLARPLMKWEQEQGALYTVVLIDFGIERLGGKQYYHWLVANVADPYSLNSGQADEVKEYVPPFYFGVTADGKLDQTRGKRGHDILVLLYKQRAGRVDMAEERQSGCNPGFVRDRIGDHVALAEKYELELVAGNFFFTTYTEATNSWLCYGTKCTGEAFPFPIAGINDGPECKQEQAEERVIEWKIKGEPFEECIAPGMEIKFTWAGEAHNVQEVSAAGYEDCSGIKNTAGVEGPFKFTAPSAGTYYFVCGVGGHCEFGKQKAKITVDPSC